MQYSQSNSITSEFILSEVLPLVGENGDYRELPKGFYLQQIQKCLEALSFDSYFDKRIVSLPVPDNLAIDIPKGMFNLRQMYLNTGDGCGIGDTSVNVYYKSNFFNNDGKGGKNFVSRNKGDDHGNDPFYSGVRGSYLGENLHESNRSASSRITSRAGRGDNKDRVHYYNIQNGVIMLSSSCKNYPYVLMEFNAISSEIGDKSVVPIQFREVIVDFVVEAVLRVKASRNAPVFMAMYNDSKQQLGRNPYHTSGTWFNAIQRAASLNSKDREDLGLYYGNFIK